MKSNYHRSGGFIENAPEEYSFIKEIYLKYRTQRIEEISTHSMVIWRAYPEMLQRTGLSYPELSKVLVKMSVATFLNEPARYFHSVFHINLLTSPMNRQGGIGIYNNHRT